MSAGALRHASRDMLAMAVSRFDEHGPNDARGAATWDCAIWLDERAETFTSLVPAGLSADERRQLHGLGQGQVPAAVEQILAARLAGLDRKAVAIALLAAFSPASQFDHTPKVPPINDGLTDAGREKWLAAADRFLEALAT